MKWGDWLENWGMSSLKLKAGFLETEWKPNPQDKQAAWELYVELLTRITTQALHPEHGDEKTALDSVFSLFPTTRQILRQDGRSCREFTKISVIVLNQVVRPFTAKWHKASLAGQFEQPGRCAEFREELVELQKALIQYTKMLAQMADVEDLSALEGEI
jgi:hypothetical protein